MQVDVPGDLGARQRLEQFCAVRTLAGKGVNLVRNRLLRPGVALVDQIDGGEVPAQQVLDGFRVGSGVLGVHDEYGGGVVAAVPDALFVHDELGALAFHDGAPGLLHQRGVHLLAHERGGHVGRVNRHDGHVAALVARLQAVFVQQVAQADVLGRAARGHGDLFPGEALDVANSAVLAAHEHRARVGRTGVHLHRHAAHKRVHGRARADVGRVDGARRERLVHLRAVGKFADNQLHAAAEFLLNQALVDGHQSRRVGHVGKHAEPQLFGLLGLGTGGEGQSEKGEECNFHASEYSR